MERVFVSYCFAQDRDLFVAVETILRSLGIVAVIGDAVGGAVLTPGVMRLIEESHGLVALMTQREARPAGGFTTHPWVVAEYNHARGRNLPAIAIVQRDVVLEGAYQEHERIAYDPAAPKDAIIKLVQTIGVWKRDAGIQLKVRILPEKLGQMVAAHAMNGVRCTFRAYVEGKAKPWKEASVVREYGGAFAYLRGVEPDSLIEVQIQIGKQTWVSEAVPQFMYIQLRQARR